MNVQLLQTLLEQLPPSLKKEWSLRNGQTVYGKVEKLFPNDMALVQIGGRSLVAELKAPVTSGEHYWFQVVATGENIQLKMIERSFNANQPLDETKLIEQLRLPNSKHVRELLKFLIKESLPIVKEDVLKAAEWLKTADLKTGLQAIRWMYTNNLPFTNDVFQAMIAFQNEKPFHEQLNQLQSSLAKAIANMPEKEGALFQLHSFLRDWPSVSDFSPSELAKMFKKMIQWLGLQHEAKSEPLTDETKEQLKSLLIKALQECPEQETKKEMANVLHRLTAQQLFSHDQGPIQQIFTQFPLLLGKHWTDVTIQWRGKKEKNGKLDTDYCRILFYLTLETLKETVIDVQIQQRIVQISIVNDTPNLQQAISSFQPLLKKNLADHHYTLSSIKVIPTAKKQNERLAPIEPSSYKGVDYRV
ncbi:hypothetical protein EDD69_105156 [Thermolongibacillus altinsuensis]|uniref:Flagellar hook-length control protein FliK n=1 Tax=Thermolongibacillus altinsuensis TaxID=575256 RepID=A0A4R1QPP2_9BACL|nr:hypothetical protein [Thermolongibacillus altinsuensis]TCL50355.1 hypothetical protein EDD69_105156 [Thermolongibacillus altinsuensis]